jgi:riboflavin synthase
MFTGIIVATGLIASRQEHDGDLRMELEAGQLDLAAISIGNSISVQGVCLTVTRKEGSRFFADVSRETLAKTTLGARAVGARVNFEPSLRAGDQLGGHLVSGHVDAVARLVALTQDGRSWRMRFALPAELARFVAPKGSICIDGVSLTVNEVQGSEFGVNIIPHTHHATTLGELREGDGVNVEIDQIARYLDRLIESSA